ncbi:MAG: 3-deoxy-manno-octulosonate cytidylyltransferase [Bacteroidales bacterium]|nr:3-deoxy-manno-octulosonate cytidylyltransferase [Bacteroidales bacterium]
MKVLAVIPARYASTRFPGKPLALIAGRPMIQWVWEGVSRISVISDAVVATDDTRIFDAVLGFGGRAMMTASTHRSGTDRCGEVLDRMDSDADVIVNVQGDEPRVEHTQIELLASCFDDPSVQIATLKKEITSADDLFSPNVVKVVDDLKGNAIYFSRNPIPFVRGAANDEWLQHHKFYKHIGIYAFRREVLQQVVRLPQSQLETCESLEQLRWIENGYRIAVRETDAENIGVDTPEDLAKLQMEQ